MTWHLKDRELERKLVGLYPSFLDDLKFGVMNKGNRHYVHVECTRVRGNEDIPNDTVSLWYDELEEVHEYNPKAWNDSRKITPPENVVFRAKVYRASLYEETGVYYKALIYKDSKWYYVINGKALGTQLSLYEGDYVEFKAWED